MEELCVNHVLHDIKITFCSTHDVLPQRINYEFMAIEEENM